MRASLLLLSLGAAIKSASADSLRRHLSFDEIAGYEPTTVVTDYNAIDLDLKVIEEQMNGNDETVINNALQIYTIGGNVASFAILQLKQGLNGNVRSGIRVTGHDSQQTPVTGTTLGAHSAGSTELRMLYLPNSIQENYLSCRVGALGLANQAITTGCLTATGTVSIDNVGTFAYDYNVSSDNRNLVSLGSISRDRNVTEAVLYPTLEKYNNYYLTVNYADIWVRAAMQAATTFELQRGRADFTKTEFAGRTLAATLGIVVLNLWGEVILQMEESIRECQNQRNGNPHWDLAVAYYTGSLEGTTGDGQGLLLHQMADDLCVDFRACGDNANEASGRSYTNRNVLRNVRIAKSFFIPLECNDIRVAKEGVEESMVIPLIQGLLKFAYQRSVGPDTDTLAAASATYGAAVLPLLQECNSDDAATVYRNVQTSSSTVDFAEVKSALERNYGCLKINCGVIGGLYDQAAGDYYQGANPCVDPTAGPGIGSSLTPPPTPIRQSRTPTRVDITSPPRAEAGGNKSGDNQAAVIGGSIAGVVVFIIIVLVFLFIMVRRNKEADPERQGNAPEFKEGTPESSEMT